jgi:hypothetical protein
VVIPDMLLVGEGNNSGFSSDDVIWGIFVYGLVLFRKIMPILILLSILVMKGC